MGYSFWLTARVLLYAPSHRQDNTYHGLCYTSRGTLAGTRNSSMGPPHEGSIQRPIAPWVNALTTELHLAPLTVTISRKEKQIWQIKKSRSADKCGKFSSMVVNEHRRTLASASSCSRTCTSVELVLGSWESLVSSLSSPSIRLACSSSYTVHAPYILSTRWDRSSDAARMFPHRCWIDSSSRGMFGNSIR